MSKQESEHECGYHFCPFHDCDAEEQCGAPSLEHMMGVSCPYLRETTGEEAKG